MNACHKAEWWKCWNDQAILELSQYPHRDPRRWSLLLHATHAHNCTGFDADFTGVFANHVLIDRVASYRGGIFHANGDPTTNNWAADSIGRTRQVQYYGGMSEGTGARGGGGMNQSAGGSQFFEYLIQPQEFTMLRTGGEECELQVDAIIFQGGRRWVTSTKAVKATQNFIRHVFPQVYS